MTEYERSFSSDLVSVLVLHFQLEDLYQFADVATWTHGAEYFNSVRRGQTWSSPPRRDGRQGKLLFSAINVYVAASSTTPTIASLSVRVSTSECDPTCALQA